MKKLVIITFLTFSLFIYSQDRDYTKIPQIQSKATYTTEVQPDKITLSITLAESNSKGKISVEQLEIKLLDVLKLNQIDISKNLTLKDLSSNFQSYFLKRTEVVKSKNYNLEINSAKVAGKILKELSENDISNVKLLKTEYSKLEELKIELKGKAVEKAKRQAEEMVKSLDKKVGSVIFIADSDANISNYLSGRVSGLNIRGANSISNYDAESETADVSFDNIKIEVTVMVYFELK